MEKSPAKFKVPDVDVSAPALIVMLCRVIVWLPKLTLLEPILVRERVPVA